MHAPCLSAVATSAQGSQCLAEFLTAAPERQCITLSNAANCAASQISDMCGYDALTLSFEGMQAFAKQVRRYFRIQCNVTEGSSEDIANYEAMECLVFEDSVLFG
ncbi:unnamed protein product [Gongylonema pulchrum]|uniref:Elicitin-like protein n=1 Tax=Gongylonema pulchrum TaxID=637853 RepID=A0A183D7U9_9BILA|nr:unnamed protein product [Gongylonema pulchrum]